MIYYVILFLLSSLIFGGNSFDLGPLTNVHLETLKSFAYTGSIQSFEIPVGYFTLLIKLCGAKGGDASNGGMGGKGGCVSTFLDATPGKTLYVFVGGPGGNQTNPENGGYNGGGKGGIFREGYRGGGGGGATDIRWIPTDLSSRIAVAGGGGGGASFTAHYGGAGGGEKGGTGGIYEKEPTSAGGGGDTSKGGNGGTVTFAPNSIGSAGTLGNGGDGATKTDGGGGGGGYYGGGGGAYAGGGGGSSILFQYYNSFVNLMMRLDNLQPYDIGQGNNPDPEGSVTVFAPCPLNTIWNGNQCMECAVGSYTPIHGASCIPLHSKITYDSSLSTSFSFYFVPNNVEMLLVHVWEYFSEGRYYLGGGRSPDHFGDVVTAYIPVRSNDFLLINRDNNAKETSIYQFNHGDIRNESVLISVGVRSFVNTPIPFPLFPGWIRKHQFNINKGSGKVILRPACAPGTYRTTTIDDKIECIACDHGTYSLFPDSLRCLSPGHAVVLPYVPFFAPYWLKVPIGVTSLGIQLWGAGGSAGVASKEDHIMYGGGAGL